MWSDQPEDAVEQRPCGVGAWARGVPATPAGGRGAIEGFAGGRPGMGGRPPAHRPPGCERWTWRERSGWGKGRCCGLMWFCDGDRWRQMQ